MTLLPYYDLDIPVPGLKTNLVNHGWELPIPKTHEVQLTKDNEIFTDEVLDFFRARGLTSTRSQMFCNHPGPIPGGIHIDGYYKDNKLLSNIYAINWIVNPENSVMRWYKSDSPSETKVTSGGTTLTKFSPETAVMTHEKNIIGPTLVRADIPHNVVNFGTQTRWCYSLRFTPYVKSWKEAVEMFSDLIIK